MDSQDDEGGMNIGNRQRKFGLPGWMVNNIERLNFVTDFEQYASSPPETESFLTDYMESHSMAQENNDSCSTVEFKNTANDATARDSRPLHVQAENRHPSQLLLDSPSSFHSMMKHEELFSSPDSTPCATPEPSPVVRRKVSIPHPQDTVLTNPGRWFYMGKLKKSDSNRNNKENKTVSSNAPREQQDMPRSKPKKTAIKLVISNFDLNAVSPTSW